VKLSFAALALALSATASNAAVFDWTVAAPDFFAPVNGTNLSETKTGNDTTLNWGTPTARNVPRVQSSWTFDGLNGSLNINPGETKDFVFGTFAHHNSDLTRSTENGELGGASLRFDLTLLGGYLFNPVFQVTHNETLNLYSGPNAWPKCCDDRAVSTTFDIGEIVQGDLKFAVFLTAIDFLTKEGTTTTTQWLGKVSLAEIPPIPIPPAALLFGSALAGIATLARKKRRG
jgi:hypothetical protein